MGYVADKWRQSHVSERLCYSFREQLIRTINANRKVAPGCQCASENRGCQINGPWPVHRLRHRKGDPLCIAIVWYTSLDMVLGGFLKSTDDAIQADMILKRSAGVNEPAPDIKDVNNSCFFSEGTENKYVQT